MASDVSATVVDGFGRRVRSEAERQALTADFEGWDVELSLVDGGVLRQRRS